MDTNTPLPSTVTTQWFRNEIAQLRALYFVPYINTPGSLPERQELQSQYDIISKFIKKRICQSLLLSSCSTGISMMVLDHAPKPDVSMRAQEVFISSIASGVVFFLILSGILVVNCRIHTSNLQYREEQIKIKEKRKKEGRFQ